MKQIHLTISALLLSLISFAVPGPIAGSGSVCSGATTTLSDTASGGVWSSSNTSIASVGFSTGVVTGVSAGIATITYTVGVSFVTLPVTVNALPALYYVSGGGYCTGGSGGTIYLSGSDAGVHYQLYKNGVISGAPITGTGTSISWGPTTTAGTYTVIASNPATSCGRNMPGSAVVAVYPPPATYSLTFYGSGVFCSGTPSSDLYLSGSQTGVNYQLFRNGIAVGSAITGFGSAIDFGPIVPVTGDNYTVVGTSGISGCISTSGPITTTVLPSPGPILGPTGVCVGSTITLSDTSTGGTWHSSNVTIASVGTSGIVSGVSAGSATITYTNTSGCSATYPITVVNLIAPIGGASTACTGVPVAITDPSAGGTWVSTNTSVATIGSSNGILSPIAAGTTTINYTIGGTCGFVSRTITVNPSPAPLTGITSVCAGGTTSLGCITPGGAWSSSNTAVATIGTSGVTTSVAAGSATLSYTLPTGCKSSVVLSVDPPPVITGAGSVCVGNTTTFITSIPGSWTSSNPFVASITAGGIITGITPGTAIITCNSFSTGCVSTHNITVTSGCSGTPAGGTAHAVTASICAGTADVLYLTGASSTCGVSYQWQYSADSIYWLDLTGATNDTIAASPESSTYYRCKVKCYTSGLYAYSAPVLISVYNLITSHYMSNAPSYYCNGPMFFIGTCGVQPASNILSYYGDGTSDSTPISYTASFNHAYSLPGTYTIKQILRNGTVAQDSVSYVYTYNYCRTLPVQFYFDANSNCINDDVSNLYQPITTEVDSAGIPVDTVTATYGFYYQALGGPGTVYTFKVIGFDTGLALTCPSSSLLHDTISSFTNTYGPVSFGFNCSTSAAFDLSVHAAMTCGRHTAQGFIYLGNTFCTVENPVVTMTFSPDYQFNSSSIPPYSIVGNTVTWHFTGVSAYTNYYYCPFIYFDLTVPGPFLTAGDTVQTSFSITPLSGDVQPANNYYARIDTILASYDPNGISVAPQGKVIPCTPLQYAIRFENTGNDTAHNIAVVDTLPATVVPSSVKIVSATSAVNLIVHASGGYNIVKFDFPHINLPDSTHHDVCRGEVIFSVNVRPSLPDGTQIANHASIYFDDNLPVITDTVINSIGTNPVTGPGSACVGGTLLLADASSGGNWSASNSNASVSGGLVTAILPGTDTIRYTLSNACTSRSSSMAVTINPVIVPAVNISTNSGMGDSICVGTMPVFTATPGNGGPAPLYEWFVNGLPVGPGDTYSYFPSAGDVVSVQLTSNAVCVQPDTVSSSLPVILLNPMAPADSLIANPGIFISPGTSDTFVAIITGGGSIPTFEWLVNGLPTGDTTDTFITHSLVNNDSVTCVTTSTDLCHLSSFNSFIISVSPVGVPSMTMGGDFAVFPNPNKGDFTIRAVLNTGAGTSAIVEITDLLGQTVFKHEIPVRNGAINEPVHLGNQLANGMYLLSLRSGTLNRTFHFIIGQ